MSRTSKLIETKSDRVFDFINLTIMIIILIIVVYPLYFIVIASFSDPIAVTNGKVLLFPKGISLMGYSRIFENKEILMGYKNSILYTFVGTLINLFLTMTAAYSLSRKDMPGRNGFMLFFAFTMFFGGGLIPTYLVMKQLNLLNTFRIMVLIGGVSVYNVIIARTFIQSNIPNELREASSIDGCDDFTFFFKMVLPLSKAVIAVLCIYYAVAHWNNYFNALIYLRDRDKFNLQLLLREILIRSEAMNELDVMQSDVQSDSILVNMSLRYSLIIVASIPVLILYPFLQKYFMKGVMVGAIKG